MGEAATPTTPGASTVWARCTRRWGSTPRRWSCTWRPASCSAGCWATAPRLRHQPQQPGRAVPGDGGLPQGAAAVPRGPRPAQGVRRDGHPHYATSLNNLAELYGPMGDFARACRCSWRPRPRKQCWERPPPTTPPASTPWPCCTRQMGDYARALPPFVEARDLRKEVLGERHPDYAHSLNNLAGLYRETGE